MEHLKEAVEADRAALQVTTMESDPENWADTQKTLFGDALQELGKRERNTNDLEQAIASYQEAAKVQTRDRDPISWAATQDGIANTYEVLGMREPSAGGIVHLQQAVAAYEAALTVSTPDNDPVNWPISQDNLARTQSELGEREAGTNYLQQAAASYREEAGVSTGLNRSPTRWKERDEGLNNVLQSPPQRECFRVVWRPPRFRCASQIVDRSPRRLAPDAALHRIGSFDVSIGAEHGNRLQKMTRSCALVGFVDPGPVKFGRHAWVHSKAFGFSTSAWWSAVHSAR